MSNLIITRRNGEAVHIGDDIVVRVERIQADRRVRISVSAPRSVKILREELVGTPPRQEAGK